MFIFINIWNIYIYVTVLKLRKYGIELYTPTKETDTRHQYFWVGQFSYCRSVVRNPSPTCNLQNSKVPCKFSVGFQSIGGLNGGNISYHQISKYPKIWHKKTQKIFQQKRGGGSGFHHFFLQVIARWWTSCWLQEPRPACVLPMLRSKGRHRNKPPSWRRPQNAPKKGYRKSPDDREASTRYVRENVAFSLGDILAKFTVKNWDNYTAELNWLAKMFSHQQRQCLRLLQGGHLCVHVAIMKDQGDKRTTLFIVLLKL